MCTLNGIIKLCNTWIYNHISVPQIARFLSEYQYFRVKQTLVARSRRGVMVKVKNNKMMLAIF